MQNENNFETIIANLEEGQSLMIGDQTFLNELILDQSLQCSILYQRRVFEIKNRRVLSAKNKGI